VRKLSTSDRTPQAVRRTTDSGMVWMNILIGFLPNPDKLRARLMRTGRDISLGNYLLVTVLMVFIFALIFHTLQWSQVIVVPLALMLGLGLPHFVIGYMGAKRIKKFLANFPEAIDTMCRGIRSGLPVTESIAAVGREMPDPIGLEFHRIADGVRMGRSLEASMWEVTKRISTPEFRFLIIAMAIQKETGGNLAETLGNLSDLIRKRRQLRLKIKAMSSEAKASAMIIGSLPFIMFTLLMVVNSEYMMTLFNSTGGKILMGVGVTWMSIGWIVMTKMIHFEL
jgi:tight adherence protein B